MIKTRYNYYTIYVVLLLFIQSIISSCTMASSRGLYKEEVELDSQQLFQDKCSKCHELPDIDAYPYTPEDWSSIIDIMHDTKEAGKFITIEEEKEIKNYLRKYLNTRKNKLPDIGEE